MMKMTCLLSILVFVTYGCKQDIKVDGRSAATDGVGKNVADSGARNQTQLTTRITAAEIIKRFGLSVDANVLMTLAAGESLPNNTYLPLSWNSTQELAQKGNSALAPHWLLLHCPSDAKDGQGCQAPEGLGIGSLANSPMITFKYKDNSATKPYPEVFPEPPMGVVAVNGLPKVDGTNASAVVFFAERGVRPYSGRAVVGLSFTEKGVSSVASVVQKVGETVSNTSVSAKQKDEFGKVLIQSSEDLKSSLTNPNIGAQLYAVVGFSNSSSSTQGTELGFFLNEVLPLWAKGAAQSAPNVSHNVIAVLPPGTSDADLAAFQKVLNLALQPKGSTGLLDPTSSSSTPIDSATAITPSSPAMQSLLISMTQNVLVSSSTVTNALSSAGSRTTPAANSFAAVPAGFGPVITEDPPTGSASGGTGNTTSSSGTSTGSFPSAPAPGSETPTPGSSDGGSIGGCQAQVVAPIVIEHALLGATDQYSADISIDCEAAKQVVNGQLSDAKCKEGDCGWNNSVLAIAVFDSSSAKAVFSAAKGTLKLTQVVIADSYANSRLGAICAAALAANRSGFATASGINTAGLVHPLIVPMVYNAGSRTIADLNTISAITLNATITSDTKSLFTFTSTAPDGTSDSKSIDGVLPLASGLLLNTKELRIAATGSMPYGDTTPDEEKIKYVQVRGQNDDYQNTSADKTKLRVLASVLKIASSGSWAIEGITAGKAACIATRWTSPGMMCRGPGYKTLFSVGSSGTSSSSSDVMTSFSGDLSVGGTSSPNPQLCPAFSYIAKPGTGNGTCDAAPSPTSTPGPSGTSLPRATPTPTKTPVDPCAGYTPIAGPTPTTQPGGFGAFGFSGAGQGNPCKAQ